MERVKEIERSIIKKYRKQIFSKFVKAVKEYELIKENDVIGVCISGGKDSFVLAKCMQELLKHGKFHYELKFIVMNPGYTKEVLNQIKENLNILEINAEIFDANIFEYVDTTDNPCYLCAKMRRGYLYDYAKKLGCNKIALGHHFNDVIETTMLNLIFNGTYSTMMPKLKSDNFEGMELIRPLYMIKEEDIIAWSKYNNLKFIDCACSVTKKNAGKRVVIKNLINNIKEIYEDADKSIFTSSRNVNLNTVIKCKYKDKEYSFLDEYSDNKNNL